MSSKVCNSCKQSLPLTSFRKAKGYRDGYTGQCKACIQAKQTEWGRANKGKCAEYRRKSKTPEAKARYAEQRKQRMANDPLYAAQVRAKNAERMSTRRQALARIPLTEEQRWLVDEVYDLCARRSVVTGVPHHVDHIVPLVNESVCGLHVPWNLQVLTAHENCSKSNRH